VSKINPLFLIDLDRVIDAGRESQHQITSLANCIVTDEFRFDSDLTKALISEVARHTKSLLLPSPTKKANSDSLTPNKEFKATLVIGNLLSQGVPLANAYKVYIGMEDSTQTSEESKEISKAIAKTFATLISNVAQPLVTGDHTNSLKNTVDGADWEREEVLKRIKKGFATAMLKANK
jgi:hypothetical protein